MNIKRNTLLIFFEGTLRRDIVESKNDLIKWMVGMWIAQMAAIVFLVIKK